MRPSLKAVLFSGAGNNAALTMDFQKGTYVYRNQRYANPQAIPGWTFTRASGAYAPTASGSLVWFASGEPRITDAGFTVEGAATNVTQSSQTFNNAQWTRRGTATAADNSILAPDNTLTGSLITGVGASGTNDFYESAFGTAGRFANNAALAWSFYIRPVSTSGTLRITNAQSSTLGEFTINMASLTPNVWQRVFAGHPAVTTAFAFVASATGIAGLQFSCTAGAPISFYLWGVQLETGTQATTYIPTTTTAVTRAADNPYIADQGGAVRTNLLLQSQAFDSVSWSKTDTTITANATVAPDGTTTADLLTVAVTNAEHHVSQGSLSVVNGTAYTVSVFAKAGTENVLFLWNSQGGSMGSVNLSTGAVTGGVTAQLSGNGNYRVQATFTASATTTREIRFYIKQTTAYTGAGESLSLWGAQLETGSTATAYIPTTGSAVTVRDPFTGIGRDLGMFRTNLLTYSQALDNAAWVKGQTTVTADAVTAPDGTTTADRVFQTAVTNNFHVQQAFGTTVSGTAYTSSIYARQGTSRYIQLTYSTGGFAGTQYANVDLQTGTVGTIGSGASVSVVDAGGGWWRIAYASTANAAASAPFFVFMVTSNTAARVESFAGNAANYVDLWGAQVETGPVVTDYIPTTTAPVTVGNPFTMAVDAYLPAGDGVSRVLATASDLAGANTTRVRRGVGNDTLMSVTASGANQNLGSASGFTGALSLKMAGRQRVGEGRLAVNGTLRTAASINNALMMDRLFLGLDVAGFSPGNLQIRKLVLYGDLTNAQAQAVTT